MATPSTKRKVLVTGATGKQGRSFIEALRDSEDFQLLALTRDTASPAAKALASSEPHVTVVQGSLDSEESIRKVFVDHGGGEEGIWGVFMVLAFPGLGASGEGVEKQGTTLANLALEFKVSFFMYSSRERGGETDDDDAKLDYAAKVKVERHIRSLGEKGLRWCLLRPAFFMENYEGTIGRITATVLKCGLKPDTKVQLIAANDIGYLAAAAFKDPDANVNKILVAAGDILTMKEQDEAYVRGTGKHLPTIPTALGQFLISINQATKGVIADIERVNQLRTEDPAGYESHLVDARAAYPKMTSFEEWARRRKAEPRDANWNQVSLLKLITGRH